MSEDEVILTTHLEAQSPDLIPASHQHLRVDGSADHSSFTYDLASSNCSVQSTLDAPAVLEASCPTTITTVSAGGVHPRSSTGEQREVPEAFPSPAPRVVTSDPNPLPSTSGEASFSHNHDSSHLSGSQPLALSAVNLNEQYVNQAFGLDEDIDYALAPPTYDEVINSTRFPIVRSGNRAAGEDSGWQLNFVDFTPHLSTPGDRYVGDFRSLIKRANVWLKLNPDVELKTCETVTWTATSLKQMSETDVVYRSKSLTASLKTRYLRGLRLWFVPHSGSGAQHAADAPITINMENFAPESPCDTMDTLVKRANKQFKERPLSGKVLTMETVFTRTSCGKIYASTTFWSESPAKARQYTFFLRVFYVVGRPRREEIGIQDFLPEQRSDSYENFSEVMEKGSCWAAAQTDTRITNMQAVFVKRKGTPQTSHDRCFYTEHALKTECRVTYYYQVLRVYYAHHQSELNIIAPIALRITKKTFAPAMLPPVADEREPKFESFSKTVERVSSWLDSTRAEVLCVETVPVRMNTGTQQRLGPEATLVWSQPEVGVRSEDWLLFVRLYVKGEYQELRVRHALSMPPVDWYRRQHHEPIRRTARRKRNCFVFCIVFLFLVTASFVVVYILINLIGIKIMI